VADMHGIKWQLDFRRNLGSEEVLELEELMDILESVQIQDIEDIVTWALEPSGKFSSRSLYRLMTNPGEVGTRMKEMWEVKIPLKIKIFLWMLWHDRV
jgi:hypothetical protein